MPSPLRNSALTGRFKLWEYRVGHRQLLLRRCKRDGIPKNFDIMFFNVSYLDLPAEELEFEVAEPSREDFAVAEARSGEPVAPYELFILICGGRRHMVVAGNAVYDETDMGAWESPFAIAPKPQNFEGD